MEDQEASSLRFDDINNCEVDNQVDGADNCFAINNLPHLIFVNILSYLSVEDLGSASCVSKYWYNSCLDPQLWKIIKLKKRRKVDDKVLGWVTNHGSNASVLDVSECPNITEDGLIKALWRCRLLVELTVVRCSAVTDECLSVIGKSCKKIKSLDITLCSVTDKGLQEVRLLFLMHMQWKVSVQMRARLQKPRRLALVSFMLEITINTYYHNLCKVLAPEVIMIMLNKKATPV